MMKTKKLLSYLTMGVLFTGVAFADDSDVVDIYEEGSVGYAVDGPGLADGTGDKSGDTKDTTKYEADGLNKEDAKAAEEKAKKTEDTSKGSDKAADIVGDVTKEIGVVDIR